MKGFIAYPSQPQEIGQTVRAAVDRLDSAGIPLTLQTWEEGDVAGRFLIDPILRGIDESDVLVADLTILNFNVVFEIGYAIGRSKRVMIVRNRALRGSDDTIRQVGIFDTLGYLEYSTSAELVAILQDVSDTDALPLVAEPNTTAPIFIVLPRQMTDAEIRFVSRIKKARLHFRKFDPQEHGRLPGPEAIEQVAQSLGVATMLLPSTRRDSDVHNFRVAFIAGLAWGMDRALLLLQSGEDPVPLDYRDLVAYVRFPDHIDQHIAEFSGEVTGLLQAGMPPAVEEPKSFLAGLTLGASSAENELRSLAHYYLETDEFRRTLRGEVRVVAGRKGAGKTALFFQLRNKLRGDRDNIVLDLKPEGFQLLKFKERVLDYLGEGTRAHTITAFWEYLLLLETCHKILVQDDKWHMRDNRLYEPYRALTDRYYEDAYVTEGDFAERMLKLTDRISDDFENQLAKDGGVASLTRAEVTELLYVHDLGSLREALAEYLRHKDALWILFDNLDKGWSAHGVEEDDVLTLRCLIDAMTNMERQLRRGGINAHGMIFIRNDVLELLIAGSADRGKISQVMIDWTDPELLREMLRRRMVYGGADEEAGFDQIWREIAATHVGAQESSGYLIERCLMRPRALLELVAACRSHAVNLGRNRITAEDIVHGEEAFGTELVNNISFELQDVLPGSKDALYEFLEAPKTLTAADVKARLHKVVAERDVARLFEMLLWHGVFGVVRENDAVTFIYDTKYDMRRLLGLMVNRGGDSAKLMLNPAFWQALEAQEHDGRGSFA